MVGHLAEHLGAEQFEASLVLLQPEITRQEAFGEIVRQVPGPLRRYLGVQGIERQQRAGTTILTQLRNRLDEIEGKHPELFNAAKKNANQELRIKIK
jgi:hypothetical protein